MLHAIAAALLERETLTREDIAVLVRGDKLPPRPAGAARATAAPAPPAPIPVAEPASLAAHSRRPGSRTRVSRELDPAVSGPS